MIDSLDFEHDISMDNVVKWIDLIKNLGDDINKVINTHEKSWDDNTPTIVIILKAMHLAISAALIAGGYTKRPEVLQLIEMFADGIKDFIKERGEQHD